MVELSDFSDLRGELAALLAAFLWAVSSVVYGRLGQRISPLLLNLLKGAIAIIFLGLTLAIARETLPPFIPVPIAFLLISGVIGIGLGDTAYFSALNSLGARRTLLFEILAPPMAAVLALIFLNERLSAIAWGGIFLTILGVAWVIGERTSHSVLERQQARRGIFWAFLAAVAQASGAVLSRAALAGSPISPLWSSLLRLSAGTLCVLFLLGLRRPQRQSPQATPVFTLRLVGVIMVTAFASTYLAIWLQQTSLKFAATGIAQTLSATSPVFVLPIAAALGEKISLRAILGVLVAIAGIAILFGS